MHILCRKSNKEKVKGQGDTLHIYDRQLLHCVITREKTFRDTEHAKQPNFCCQPIWIVIYTNCWCNFSMTALNCTEQNPFSLRGAIAASLVFGFCHVCVVPMFLAARPGRAAQRGFNVTWVLSNVKEKGRSFLTRNG